MRTHAKRFRSLSREDIAAVHSVIADLNIQMPKRPCYGQISREEIEQIVASLPAENLVVLRHGRKRGPRPGSLFYGKWQERELLAGERGWHSAASS